MSPLAVIILLFSLLPSPSTSWTRGWSAIKNWPCILGSLIRNRRSSHPYGHERLRLGGGVMPAGRLCSRMPCRCSVAFQTPQGAGMPTSRTLKASLFRLRLLLSLRLLAFVCRLVRLPDDFGPRQPHGM